MPSQFQFSIKDMFLSVTLLCFGFGGFAWLREMRIQDSRQVNQLFFSVVMIGSMMALAAGFHAPLKYTVTVFRWRWAPVAFAAICILVVILLFVMVFTPRHRY